MNTKATSLNINIKNGIIPKIYFFTVNDFKKNKKQILTQIKKKFVNTAIRSSSFYEDKKGFSNAGKFKSFLNISTKNMNLFESKINEVINSYKDFEHPKNQILIQKMVENVKFSGVVTTHDKNDFSPYYVVNFSKSSNTDIITSGLNKNNKTYYIFRKYNKNLPKNISSILNLCKELEKKTKNKYLDIEFAITGKNIYLLQHRPLAKQNKISIKNENNIEIYLKKLERKISKLKKKNCNLLGKTTYFGLMPDWNPAEIIGKRPSQLALSLYRELITDNIWSTQRNNYGYKNLHNINLMISLFGIPYIDLRTDFNSWVPKNLNKNLSSKLVNYYLYLYKKNPNYHDKIEFKIINSCHTLSSKDTINKIPSKFLSGSEKKLLIKSLERITKKTFSNINIEKNKIKLLEIKFKEIRNSKMYALDKIYWLIENCKNFGTLPFAGLARSAFVGTEILKSLKKKNLITDSFENFFLQSINTITTDLKKDLYKLEKKDFIKKYGHLRPNTYDIDTKNYREAFDIYFKKENLNHKEKRNKFVRPDKKKINLELRKNNFDIDSNKLFSIISESIRLREYSKFLFTKYIDEIFINLKILFKRIKIDQKNIKFISISTIKKLFYSLDQNDLRSIFSKEIKQEKFQSEINSIIKLPTNIYSSKDIFFFSLQNDEPNFITKENTIADMLYLKNFDKKNNYNNKIVCIENADPGYDFLFSHNIKGLITKFGGINSHMSIRCNELNIPAAIGVGEKIFTDLINSNKVQLNCENKTLKFI